MSDQPDHDREGSDSDENDVFVDQQDGEVADGDEVYDLEGDGRGSKPYPLLLRSSVPDRDNKLEDARLHVERMDEDSENEDAENQPPEVDHASRVLQGHSGMSQSCNNTRVRRAALAQRYTKTQAINMLCTAQTPCLRWLGLVIT